MSYFGQAKMSMVPNRELKFIGKKCNNIIINVITALISNEKMRTWQGSNPRGSKCSTVLKVQRMCE